MTDLARSCPACTKALPDDAMFCPACGASTPTGADAATGTPRGGIEAERAEHRRRLQRALGDAYRLRDLIGSGGFAEVYGAWDPRLKREVAVKVLRADLAPTATVLERFRREAEAVAQLRHPNIVPIYLVGEGEGLVYFVMPLVKGESLATALQRERSLPVPEARRILLEAAAGLAEAHEAGLVHRDIKPENIMLEGKQRRVLLMDFGIAKAVGGAAEGGGLTMTGMIIGTPHYMSPEQASGEPEIDARADQYSLAVVGYRMLTGELPFDAKTPQLLVLRQIAEPPRPIREIRADVPVDLADALSRAMAKDSAARFPTIEALAAAIAAGAPAAVAPSSRSAEALEQEAEAREATARPIDPRLLAAGVVGLLAFGGAFRWAYPPPITAPHDPRDAAVTAGREFLKTMGAAGTFTEAVTFHSEQDNQERAFLERSLGLAEARRRVEAGLPMGHWHLRWFQPGQVEEWKVAVDRGTLLDFQHVVEEDATGANLSGEAARAMADSFVMARGWKLDSLRNLEASSVKRANRTDHHFEWEQIGSAVVLAGGGGTEARGEVRVSVDVQGARIGGYRNYFRVPDQFERSARSADAVNSAIVGVAVLAGVALALGFTIARARMGDVRWKPALAVAGVITASFLINQLNGWGNARYNANAQESAALFWGGELLGALLLMVLLGGCFLLLAAGGESLGRATVPRALAGYQALLQRRPFSPTVTRGVLRGYAVGALLLGAEAVAKAAILRYPGAWSASSSSVYTDTFSLLIPAAMPLDEIGGAIATGLLLLVVVALLMRYLRSRGLAVLIVSVAVAGLFSTDVHPRWLAAAGSVIPIALLTGAVAYQGVVASMVAFYVWQVVPKSVALLAASQGGSAAAGVVGLMLVLAPAAVLLVRSISARARQA